MPLIYAVIGCVGFGIWGYCVYPATMNSIITRAGLPTLSQGDSLMIGINCAWWASPRSSWEPPPCRAL